MRTVHIYKMSGNALVCVASGIQTGDADLDITPNSKFFEMADGTCVCYPVQTAKHTMTLTLETNGTNAENLRKAAHFGELYFEGIRIGDLEGAEGTAYRAFLTGNIKLHAKYALCNLYCVEIPIRLDASGDTLQSVEVST